MLRGDRLLGRHVVGAGVGERGGGRVVGGDGPGRAGLEVAGVGGGDRVAVLVELRLASRGLPFFDHLIGELLADDLRADELAADVDLLAVGVAGERDLADPGDDKRIQDAEQIVRTTIPIAALMMSLLMCSS